NTRSSPSKTFAFKSATVSTFPVGSVMPQYRRVVPYPQIQSVVHRHACGPRRSECERRLELSGASVRDIVRKGALWPEAVVGERRSMQHIRNGVSMTRALAINCEGLDCERLLADWRWLVPRDVTPLQIGIFGDWIFGARDGSLWHLGLLEGQFQRIAKD